MLENIVDANRKRDLWLTDRQNVYLVPQGWCDAWSVAAGFSGGLDYIDEDGKARPEVYCYAPTHKRADSPVDTLFVGVDTLQPLEEITEQEGRRIHPEMGRLLDTINA